MGLRSALGSLAKPGELDELLQNEGVAFDKAAAQKIREANQPG